MKRLRNDIKKIISIIFAFTILFMGGLTLLLPIPSYIMAVATVGILIAEMDFSRYYINISLRMYRQKRNREKIVN